MLCAGSLRIGTFLIRVPDEQRGEPVVSIDKSDGVLIGYMRQPIFTLSVKLRKLDVTSRMWSDYEWCWCTINILEIFVPDGPARDFSVKITRQIVLCQSFSETVITLHWKKLKL